MGAIECTTCGAVTTSYDEHCQGCNSALAPSPNVRMALDRLVALQDAYQKVLPHSPRERIAEIEQAVEREGCIVVNMRYLTLRSMLEKTNWKYGNFWEDVQTQRLANRNPIEIGKRMAADGHLFGQFAFQIRYALLSLDGCGANFYGEYAISLKLSAVQHRLSLLQDNAFNVAEGEIQNLHRSDWSGRRMLAVVKWAEPAAREPARPILEIVQVRGSTRNEQQFIEAHIWGPFTAAAFDSITIQQPASVPPILEADYERIEHLAHQRQIPVRRVAS